MKLSTSTHGNQKSSKIDALKDRYGRVVYNRHELYDMLYDGVDIDNVKSVDWHEDFEKFNAAIEANHLPDKLYTALEKLSLTVEEFDIENQREWFMPEKYKILDLYEYLLARLPDDRHHGRMMEELNAYDERGLIPVLRYMIYLVDTMRENGIVWGVGRGSSVASYVLYIIGIHKINSIRYELDWREFLR